MTMVRTNQGRHVTKCESCFEPLGEKFNEYDRAMTRGNPYPDSFVVCMKPECMKWAEEAVEAEYRSIRDYGDD